MTPMENSGMSLLIPIFLGKHRGESQTIVRLDGGVRFGQNGTNKDAEQTTSLFVERYSKLEKAIRQNFRHNRRYGWRWDLQTENLSR